MNVLALTPREGDILYVNRGLYKHYGVYAGNGKVVHFAPLAGKEISAKNAVIHETTLEAFLKGGVFSIDRASKAKFSREEIVRRAKERIGSKEYDLVFSNCEHFARWCVTGADTSKQVEQAVDIVKEGILFASDIINDGSSRKTGKKLLTKLRNYLS